MHYPDLHLLPSRASSSTSSRSDASSSKKHRSSTKSSSESTYSGKSTSSSSSNNSSSTSTSHTSYSSASTTSTTRTSSSRRRFENKDPDTPVNPSKSQTTLVSTNPVSSSNTSPSRKKPDNEVLTKLRSVAGERVRHSKCPPEYLEATGHRLDQHVEILTGNDASMFFIKYLGEHAPKVASSARSRRSHGASTAQSHLPQAVVFAVTTWDGDRKMVDYYMTWRGPNAKTTDGFKESEIKVLDDEFRRVGKRIDKDYKKLRRAGSTSSGTSHRSNKSKRDRSRSPGGPRKSRPPNIKLPPPVAELPTPPASGGISPEPPVSATSSVISLPYLTNVRGVPMGNRMPLMVTNPDRLSMLSEIDVLVEDPEATARPRLDVYREDSSDTPVIDVTPPDTKASYFHEHRSHPSGLTPMMKSSSDRDSVHSTETHSSASSRASSNGDDDDDDQEIDLSDLTHKFAIVCLGDEVTRKALSWHGLELEVTAPARTPKDRKSGVSSSSSSGKNNNNSSSSKSQSKNLDHSSTKKERNSPWLGPLARPDEPPIQTSSTASTTTATSLHVPSTTSHHHPQHQHQHQQQLSRPGSSSGSTASSEDGHWHEPPVVPLQPLLDNLGAPPGVGGAGAGYGGGGMMMQHSSSEVNLSLNPAAAAAAGYTHSPSPPVIPVLPMPVPQYALSISASNSGTPVHSPYALNGTGANGHHGGGGGALGVPGWVMQSRSAPGAGSPLSRAGSVVGGGMGHLPPPVAYSASPYMRPAY